MLLGPPTCLIIALWKCYKVPNPYCESEFAMNETWEDAQIALIQVSFEVETFCSVRAMVNAITYVMDD